MNVCPREGVAYDSYYNETDCVTQGENNNMPTADQAAADPTLFDADPL